MSSRPTRFVTRGTSRVAYDPGIESPGGPRVIFLHELLSDRFAFAEIVSSLEPDFRTIAIDLRGHGASASLANRQYGMDDLVADLEAVLERESLASAHFVGHGIGAAIVLALAVIHPNAVQSLTLIDPDLGKTALGTNGTNPHAQIADASYKELHDRALLLLLGQSWQTEAGPDRSKVIRRNAPALAALLTTLGICSFTESQIAALQLPINLVISGTASDSVRAQTHFISNAAIHSTTIEIDPTPGPAAIFTESRATAIVAAIRATANIP